MAVTENATKFTVKLLLNNGTSSSGDVKTVSVSYPSINYNTYDAEKVLTIEGLLSPCLSKSVYTTQAIKYYSIEDE